MGSPRSRDDQGLAAAEVANDPLVSPWLRPLEALGARSSPRVVGGKGAALAELSRRGYPVPFGWVIEAKHFVAFAAERLPRGHDLASLVKSAHTPVGIDRAARAHDRLLAEPLPEGLARALDRLFELVSPEAPWGFAARSSATCEDGHEHSLAGLAESVLGASDPEALRDAVRRVWASAYLPRALTYLARGAANGLRLPRDVAMAVVLQKMVRAEAAGVMFTAPPLGLEGETWGRDERLVQAALGLGTPVVDGSARADTFRLARRGGAVLGQVIADKPRTLVVEGRGVVDVPTEPSRRARPSLEPLTLGELARVAERVERGAAWDEREGPEPRAREADDHRGWDVEFAVERTAAGPKLWLLQVRPTTGPGYPEGGERDTVWSRANVGEALPGAATPLTWSVARAFADEGFRQAFATLGCSVDKDDKLFANVDGRFYLNLTAFMRISAQVPGLGPRALLGASGGASEQAISLLEEQVRDVSRRGFALRLPLKAPSLVLQQLTLERDIALYEQEAERARAKLLDLDLSLLPDDALATTLRDGQRLLAKTGTLMLSAASSSLASHLALRGLLERAMRPAAPGAVESLLQTLSGGVRELDSASPGLALARLAQVFRADEEAARRLLSGSLGSIDELPPCPARSALARFLEEFGDRGIREAELAQPRWAEDPRPMLAMLAASLRAGPQDPERALERARVAADRELASLEAKLGRVEMELVRVLLARSQRFARLRERMRTWVTRVLGLLRRSALDVDRRLRRIDPSLSEGGVFFCTIEELVRALASGRAELGHIVRLRRAQHARDSARPDPPVSFVGRPPVATLPPATGSRFVGLPASGGVVEGRARVLESARGESQLRVDELELEEGEILVTKTTDIGLTPLFLIAAGVVTELGGPLSHAAIVAREYGVPAVVSVPGATTAIKTGERLRVDGDRGVVERLDEPVVGRGAG